MGETRRLPSRLPPGTKYVVESRGPLVHRYVEFPDGRRVTLRPRKAPTCCAAEVGLVPRLGAGGQTRAKSARPRVLAEI